MDLSILPRRLSGIVDAVSAKSDVHRLLICASLSHTPTQIRIDHLNQDILATMDCLRQMGARIEKTAPETGVWSVLPLWENLNPAPLLDCRESGSTLRFLLPVAAAVCKRPSFSGSGRLPARPIAPLTAQMALHGCRFSADALPMTLSNGLTGGIYEIPGDVSSQFISGLLFALPLLEHDSEIQLTTPLESASYVGMTLQTLEKFGIQAEKTAGGYRVRGGQRYNAPGFVEAERDWSGAAFYLAAGAVGGAIACRGLDLSSRQPDKAILSFLQQFGANVRCADGAVCVSPGSLTGIEIDASDAPDIVPVLSIVACGALGNTMIRKAGRLRMKESDRLEAVADCITALGGTVCLTDDGMVISGRGKLTGGEVSGRNDHRIVMAAAIASILCEKPVVIRGADAVGKSYPDFFSDFTALGGSTHVI